MVEDVEEYDYTCPTTAMLEDVEEDDYTCSAHGPPGEVIPPSQREKETFAIRRIVRKITDADLEEQESFLSSVLLVDPTFHTDVLCIDITTATDVFPEDWLHLSSEEKLEDEIMNRSEPEPEDVLEKKTRVKSRTDQGGSYCSLCKNYFKRLKIHMRLHYDEKPYSCKICQKRFRQTIHLNRHKATHLPKAKRMIFDCSACHRQLSRRDKLLEHMRTCRARKRES